MFSLTNEREAKRRDTREPLGAHVRSFFNLTSYINILSSCSYTEVALILHLTRFHLTDLFLIY